MPSPLVHATAARRRVANMAMISEHRLRNSKHQSSCLWPPATGVVSPPAEPPTSIRGLPGRTPPWRDSTARLATISLLVSSSTPSWNPGGSTRTRATTIVTTARTPPWDCRRLPPTRPHTPTPNAHEFGTEAGVRSPAHFPRKVVVAGRALYPARVRGGLVLASVSQAGAAVLPGARHGTRIPSSSRSIQGPAHRSACTCPGSFRPLAVMSGRDAIHSRAGVLPNLPSYER